MSGVSMVCPLFIKGRSSIVMSIQSVLPILAPRCINFKVRCNVSRQEGAAWACMQQL